MPKVSDITEQDIERAMFAANGQLVRAAEILNIHRVTLYKRMVELGLSSERKTVLRRQPDKE